MCVFHVNMLKPYVAQCSERDISISADVLPVALASVLASYLPQEDDLQCKMLFCELNSQGAQSVK